MKKEIILRSMAIALIASMIVFISATVVIYLNVRAAAKKEIITTAAMYGDVVKTSGAEVLPAISDFGDLRVTLMTADGEVVFESDTTEELGNHLTREEVQLALEGNPRVVTRYSETFRCDMLYYAEKIDVGGTVYVLRAAQRTSDIDGYLSTSVPFVVLAMLVALGVSYLFAYQLSKGTARQLSAISETLRSVNEGRYKPIKADMKDSDFYGIMVETNTLCNALEESINAVRSERKKLNFLLDNIEQSVIAIDSSQRIVFLNGKAAALFGDSDSDGKELIRLIDDDLLFGQLCEVIVSGQNNSFEYRIGDADLNFKVIVTDSWEIAGICRIIMIEDISQEKIALREKSAFFANASHELKTPLTTMQGLTELLLDSESAQANRQKYLERIHRESKRLNSLVLDMLYISNLENGRIEEKRMPMDMARLCREIAGEYDKEIEEKKLKVEINGSLTLNADERNMHELVGNLVGNAVRYNKPNGSVKIDLYSTEEEKSVTVTDSGIGISQEHLPNLCSRFYRVDKGRSKQTGGTGLGLAIVKHVCALYSAQLDISSKVGVGTMVHVQFPTDGN